MSKSTTPQRPKCHSGATRPQVSPFTPPYTFDKCLRFTTIILPKLGFAFWFCHSPSLPEETEKKKKLTHTFNSKSKNKQNCKQAMVRVKSSWSTLRRNITEREACFHPNAFLLDSLEKVNSPYRHVTCTVSTPKWIRSPKNTEPVDFWFQTYMGMDKCFRHFKNKTEL